MKKLLFVLGLAASPLIQAESYSLLIYEFPSTLANRDRPEAADEYWSSYDRFAGELVQSGVLRGGTALDTVPVVTSTRARASKEASPVLSGYFVIDVSSRTEAEHWAGRAPSKAARVEVRAHRENPQMAAH